MPLFKTEYATGKRIMPTPQGAEVLCVQADFAFGTAMVDATGVTRAIFAINDVIEFMPLPAGCKVVDLKMVTEDVDTATTMSVQIGMLNAGRTALTSDANEDGSNITGNIINNSNACRAGGIELLSNTAVPAWRWKPMDKGRPLGIVITAAPTGMNSGLISLILQYRSVQNGA